MQNCHCIFNCNSNLNLILFAASLEILCKIGSSLNGLFQLEEWLWKSGLDMVTVFSTCVITCFGGGTGVQNMEKR